MNFVSQISNDTFFIKCREMYDSEAFESLREYLKMTPSSIAWVLSRGDICVNILDVLGKSSDL